MLKNLSFRYKLVLPLLAVELFMFLVLAWNTEFYLQKAIKDGLYTGAQAAAGLLARQYAKPLSQENIQLIDDHIQWISSDKDVNYIAIEDRRGKVLAYGTRDVDLAKTNGIKLRRFLSADRDFFIVSAPIIYEGVTLGEVQLGFSPQSTYTLVAIGRRQAIFIAFSAIGLSFLVIWLLVKTVTKPLLNLTVMAEKVAGGELSQKIEVKSADEVGQLSRAFKNMVARLEQSYSNLKEQVRDRTKELADSKRELEALFNGITDIISMQDTDYNIIVANRSAVSDCGMATLEEMAGRKCYRVYKGRNEPCAGCPVSTTIKTGKSAFAEQKNGESVFHLYSYPIIEENGRLKEIILFKKDFTRVINLERQLLQSARLAELGELAACVANEIRNPLAGISACSQVLKKSQEGERVKDELLNMILSDVERLEEVVMKFLDFASLSDSGLKSLKINEVVEETLSLVENQARMQRVELERNYDDEELMIVMDAKQIKQALLHIFINALQAMPGGGHLQVRTRSDSVFVYIKISDTGTGVLPEKIGKIFEPFFTTRHQGTGLGLCMAQMIIEKHDGSLRVYSKRGEKTVFNIELPLEQRKLGSDLLSRMSG